MPPLVIIAVIWVASPVSNLVTGTARWGGPHAVGYYLPGALGLLAAWTMCQRRNSGRWFATALVLVSVGITAYFWWHDGSITVGSAVWLILMPLVVLYTVHVRHRAWFAS